MCVHSLADYIQIAFAYNKRLEWQTLCIYGTVLKFAWRLAAKLDLVTNFIQAQIMWMRLPLSKD